MNQKDCKITVLRGAERVRRRPGVIFGDNGIDGAKTAVEMMLHTVAAEGVKGFSKQLIINLFPDGSVGLQDFGRGLALDNWQELFCDLYAGSAYEESPGSEESFALCAVQCVSEYMDVCVHREGQAHRLHFEKGENVGGLKSEPCGHTTNTYIRFKLDPEVFTDVALPEQYLKEHAQTLALLIPGMQVCFRRDDRECVYCYPKGIRDLLKESSTVPVYTASLKAQGQERYNRPKYTARVQVGVGFSEAPGFVRCYHNLRTLTYGGTHVDAVVKEIRNYLEWTLEQKIPKDKLLARLQLAVISDGAVSQWENGSRRSIQNILIRDMAQDAIDESFRTYVKENKATLTKLFQTP